jgi:hypothetical protein
VRASCGSYDSSSVARALDAEDAVEELIEEALERSRRSA